MATKVMLFNLNNIETELMSLPTGSARANFLMQEEKRLINAGRDILRMYPVSERVNEQILIPSFTYFAGYDLDTTSHSVNVALALVQVASLLQDEDTATDPHVIICGGLLHDIGKPDSMSLSTLHYKGTYTEQLNEEMEKHPLMGYDLISKYIKQSSRDTDFTPKELNKVRMLQELIVRHHMFKSFTKSYPKQTATEIIQAMQGECKKTILDVQYKYFISAMFIEVIDIFDASRRAKANGEVIGGIDGIKKRVYDFLKNPELFALIIAKKFHLTPEESMQLAQKKIYRFINAACDSLYSFYSPVFS